MVTVEEHTAGPFVILVRISNENKMVEGLHLSEATLRLLLTVVIARAATEFMK
jgi:hypothetical protein